MRAPFAHLRCIALVALLALGACGVDAWYFQSITSTGQGSTLILVWQDSPLDDAERLWVALDRVELRGGGPPVVLLDRREEHDMLTLQNGARVTLPAAEVPAGTYSTLRLTFALGASGRQRIEVGGVSHVLAFARTGGHVLDLAGPFTFDADESRRWVLDLNARLSVIQAAGTYWLDPVVAVSEDAPARVLRGTVTGPGGLGLAGATASAQRGGVESASARTRSDGSFELGPLAPGTYTLVATRHGYAPVAVTGVALGAGGGAAPVVLALATPVLPGGVDGLAPAGLEAGCVRVLREGLFVAQTGVDPLTGAFDLPALAPGFYTFELHDAQGVLDVLTDHLVSAGAITDIVLAR